MPIIIDSHKMGIPGSASVAFTDGDLVKRITVTDANVLSTSLIVGSIRRADVAEKDDVGYMYAHNIVSQGSGTFDVLITCLDVGGEDTTDLPPNETITFNYFVS